MWPKNYRDTPEDSLLKKERLEPGKGIVGCEMHEINGWGNSLHEPAKPRKEGFFSILLTNLFGPRR